MKKEDVSYQDLLPAEIWQHIFSFTNLRSIQTGRCVNTFFRANLQNKAMAIRIIESDAKYLPNITNAQLLDSVCENGIAKHHRARTGIAIRPFSNNHIEKQTDYKFYQISIAAKWFNPDTEFTEFGVDSTGLLRVSPEGDITFHGYNDINKGILDNVLQHHKPEKFLNHPNPKEWRR